MISRLKDKLSKIPFLKGVLVLATGTGLAQLIPIVTSPITRRIYTPDDFGLLSLLSSIIVISGSLSMGRYDMAVMLPKNKEQSISLCWLSFYLAFGFSLILLILVYAFGDFFELKLKSPGIKQWLFIVPVMVLGNAIYRILYVYSNKFKDYKNISRTQISRSISKAVVSIGLGLAINGSPIGLISGAFASTFAGIGVLKKRFHRDAVSSLYRSKEQLKSVAKEYIKFPKFSVWAGLANTSSNWLFDIFISLTFSISMLGQYSLSKMLCGLPSLVIGAAISQVFYQRIVEVKNKNGDVVIEFKSTLLRVAIISSCIFLVLYIVIGPVIQMVYGEQWLSAVEISKILIPFYAIRFISSSIATTTSAFEKQELTLIVNLCLLFSLVVVMCLRSVLELDMLSSISTYALILSVNYLAFILVYWNILKTYQQNLNSNKLID